MKNFIFKLIAFFFFIFADLSANESIYSVKDNQIFFQNDGNVLELRDKAKKIAFQNAFNILIKKILEPSEQSKLDSVGELNIPSLIRDFKIVEEKITDVNYSSNISVNFNSEEILDFFKDYGIRSNILVSEDYLVLPVFKKFNTLYLWEKDNYWYDYLRDEYDELGLLKLFFPERNHMNKLRISAKQILDKDLDPIKNFLSFYKKKKALIIFFQEDYELNLNRLESKVVTMLYSDSSLETIELFQEKEYREYSELSNARLISKLTINELQDWWKKKIDSFDTISEYASTFFLRLDSSDLRNNFSVEKIIKGILGEEEFFFYEFDDKETVYKVVTKYTIDKLNLALESHSLELIESGIEGNYLIVTSD